MKTTLLSLLLFSAISLPVCAQEEKKDAPRGDGDKREAAQRELVQAKESIQRSMKVAVEEVAALEKAERSMKAALEEAAALEKAGKLADAEARRRQADEQFQAARSELEQRTREARRNFEAHREGRDRSEAPRPEGAPPRAELENKLRHVEQAINHLKEAGLAEPA